MELKWIAYCTECGADLTIFKPSMSNKLKKCQFCNKTTVIDPQHNVQLIVHLTDKGKHFFRD